MTQITKNQRTHILILRDWRQLNITQEQYWTIKLARQDWKRNDPLEVKDPDTWFIIYDWELGDVKEFKQRSFWTHTYNAICDFWARHPIREWEYNCECEKQWKYTGDKLKDFVRDKYNVSYPQDITIEMKKEFYDINKQQWKHI